MIQTPEVTRPSTGPVVSRVGFAAPPVQFFLDALAQVAEARRARDDGEEREHRNDRARPDDAAPESGAEVAAIDLALPLRADRGRPAAASEEPAARGSSGRLSRGDAVGTGDERGDRAARDAARRDAAQGGAAASVAEGAAGSNDAVSADDDSPGPPGRPLRAGPAAPRNPAPGYAPMPNAAASAPVDETARLSPATAPSPVRAAGCAGVAATSRPEGAAAVPVTGSPPAEPAPARRPAAAEARQETGPARAAGKLDAPPPSAGSRDTNAVSHAARDVAAGGRGAAPGPGVRSAVTSSERNPDGAVEQLVRVLRSRMSERQSQVTMRLDPPSLGGIRISMEVNARELSLRIDSETHLAHRLLSQQADELRAALEAGGIRLERLELHPPAQPHDGAGSGADRAAQGGGDSGPSGGSQSDAREEPPAAAMTVLSGDGGADAPDSITSIARGGARSLDVVA